MTNKLLSGLAIGALLLTACSSEEPAIINGDGNVSFTAVLPAGMNTRSSFDNGTVADRLTYAVYDSDGNNITGLNPESPIVMTDKTANVTLNLVTGKEYTVVFWAQAPNVDYYTFNPADGSITVNTDNDSDTVKGDANDPKRDAFFHSETFTVSGAINKKIELKRPFAQINIGTSDLSDFTAAGGTISTSGMTVKNLPNVLDLRDGSVSGKVNYEYSPADLVSDSENFPVDGNYRWLTANFILIDDSKSTVDLTWTSDNADNPAVDYTFIPVQRNYRTNIYGALLTDAHHYDVSIDNSFNLPDNFVEVNDAQELADAFSAGGDVKIPEDASIDFTDFVNRGYTITEPVNLVVEGELTANAQGRIFVKADMTLSGGGKIVTGKDSYGILDVRDGSTLTISDMTFDHLNKKDGSPIALRANGTLNLENVVFNSDFGTIRVAQEDVNTKFNAKNCVFNSTSVSSRGNWTYALNFGGPIEAMIENCEVNGVQGGIAAVHGAVVTINGGKYSTHKPVGENGQNFYALYIAQGAYCTVLDGDFYAEGKTCVYNGNNDNPGDPLGFVFLKGGRYADQGWEQSVPPGYLYPADGYEWTAIDDAPYKWTIVKKSND